MFLVWPWWIIHQHRHLETKALYTERACSWKNRKGPETGKSLIIKMGNFSYILLNVPDLLPKVDNSQYVRIWSICFCRVDLHLYFTVRWTKEVPQRICCVQDHRHHNCVWVFKDSKRCSLILITLGHLSQRRDEEYGFQNLVWNSWLRFSCRCTTVYFS